jgi:hypothetical protein
MSPARSKVIAVQYLKVVLASLALVWFISRVMVVLNDYREGVAFAIGGYCTVLALLAIGVGAQKSDDYGRNRRRPRPVGGLSPRVLCFTTAAVLFVVSLLLDALR